MTIVKKAFLLHPVAFLVLPNKNEHVHVCVPDALTRLPITACGVNSAVSPDAFHKIMWQRRERDWEGSKVVRAVVAEALELPAACDLLGAGSPRGSH